jgi:uncharacterized membrane protein HdeD (DUF308 family)
MSWDGCKIVNRDIKGVLVREGAERASGPCGARDPCVSPEAEEDCAMTNPMDDRQERLRAIAAGAQIRVSGKLDDMWWAFLLRGLFAGGLGLCALIWPALSLSVLTRLVGIYCLADGAAGLLGSLRASERGSYLLQALLGALVGIVLLVWPSASTHTLLMIFGAWALLSGVSQIWAGVRTEDEDPARNLIISIGITAAVAGVILLAWPGTGVVVISWIIAIAALLLAGLLIYLALRLKRVKERLEVLTQQRWLE